MTVQSSVRAPLLLRGHLQPTIWGGHNLARIAGKSLPEGVTIGESWETALESVVRNPPRAGTTLGALVECCGAELIGTRAVEIFGLRFPLLTKFLDARQWLSVQVHPNDAQAATQENGKLGKTEAWYILHADPGAQLVYGLSREATQAQVRQAIAETRLEELLHTVEARAGDVILVPAGTVHAIGPGIVLYELQEYSDITYRLYDYGRLQADGKPRELHVDKALGVMRYQPSTVERVLPVYAESQEPHVSRRVLVACRYFVEEELTLRGEAIGVADGTSCHILSVLEGQCRVHTSECDLSLGLGDTAVVPAITGSYTLSAQGARLLRSYVPLADDANLQLWRAGQPVPILE